MQGRKVSSLTRKERDDKSDLNQLRTEPCVPYQDERRVIKMLWSMVSKAADSGQTDGQTDIQRATTYATLA